MAKTITLTFNSSPNVLLDENITIKIDNNKIKILRKINFSINKLIF